MTVAPASSEPLEVLCYFLHRYLSFRLQEVESLAVAAGYGRGLSWTPPEGGSEDSPFWRLALPCEAAAAAICARSVLVKALLEVWGEGATLDECVAATLSFPGAPQACAGRTLSESPFPEGRRSAYLAADTTFKVVVDGFGCHHSMGRQQEVLDAFIGVPFLGRVDLKAPQHEFWVIEVARCGGAPGEAGLPPCSPRWFFGRLLGRGNRSPLSTLDLRHRRYLGPTSMDTEVAMLMCAQGLVGPGKLVFDPFAGTGSILQAAASRGAMVMGADIDVRVLRDGKDDACALKAARVRRRRPAPLHAAAAEAEAEAEEARAEEPAGEVERVNVWTNFRDARLPLPLALLHADLAALPFRPGLVGWLHAVVCDPPYGVRAGGRRGGGRKKDENGEAFAVPPHLRHNHIPSTEFYPLDDCLADLLDASAQALVPGGRLVYFYPAVLDGGGGCDGAAATAAAEGALPAHPCLSLVASSLQVLSCKWGRRLVTMARNGEAWTPRARGEARAAGDARKAAAAAAAACGGGGGVGAAAEPDDGTSREGEDLRARVYAERAGRGAAVPWERHRGKRV